MHRQIFNLDVPDRRFPNPFFGTFEPRPRIYRHDKKIWFDAFMRSGDLYLNLINSFQDLNLGPRIGDAAEGYKKYSGKVKMPSGSEKPAAFRLTSINAYCLCLSSSSDESLFALDGKDVIYEIISDEFYLEITKALADECKGGLLEPIIYKSDRELLEDIVLHGKRPLVALTKDPSYSSQNEWRAMWEPFTYYGEKNPNGIMVDPAELRTLNSYEKVAIRHDPVGFSLQAKMVHVPRARDFVREVYRK